MKPTNVVVIIIIIIINNNNSSTSSSSIVISHKYFSFEALLVRFKLV
jgi:hypothetical protein